MNQNQIVAFDFEAHNVRIVRDDNDAPWFNAKDVCDALEMGNPSQAIKSHVDADDLQKMEVIDTMGRKQPTNHVNESGLYSLILTSRKPSAKRFKRWITSEVLPALRKTGAYAHPAAPAIQDTPHAPMLPAPASLQDRVTALLAIGKTLAELEGFNSGMAMASALDSIQANTDLDVGAFRRALPSSTSPLVTSDGLLPAPESYLDPMAPVDPSQLGAQLGMTAAEVNARLEALGLQYRNTRGEWELSNTGVLWGDPVRIKPGVVHSLHNLLWRPEVAELILDEEAA